MRKVHSHERVSPISFVSCIYNNFTSFLPLPSLRNLYADSSMATIATMSTPEEFCNVPFLLTTLSLVSLTAVLIWHCFHPIDTLFEAITRSATTTTTMTILEEASSTPLFLITLSLASLAGILIWHYLRGSLLTKTKPVKKNLLIKTGPAKRSFLHDEFEYSVKGEAPETWRLKSLWIYPVKSCCGIELSEAAVVKTG